MKILFLSSWFPYPPINGAKIRIYNLICELAKHHEITLLSFARTISIEEAQIHLQHLEQYCQTVEVFAAKHFVPNGLMDINGFLSLKPRSIVQTYSQEMARCVTDKVRTEKFDVVVASEVGAPAVVSQLANRIVGIPKVLDALEVQLFKDSYHNTVYPLHRIRNGLTWFKQRKFTEIMLQRANACTVPSEQEKQNLLEIVPKHLCVEVIPHSLDLTHYKNSFAPPQPKSLVFTGSFTYYANLDAAHYFIKEILPRVKTNLPDVNMTVVGSTEGVDFNTWPVDESITFTGLLQDVRPVVAQSWLSVVPLRIGAGTRLKIIESMALGTPVISTSKGAEGLEVTPGENILIADSPDEFAQAVVEVLKSPNLRKKLSMEGLRLVTNKYSSEVMGRNFAALLDRIASSRKVNNLVHNV